MQIRIHIWGGGMSIPFTEIGLSLLAGAAIQIRPSNDGLIKNIVISDAIGAGAGKGTLIAGSVKTDWFPIDPLKYKWANDLPKLANSIGDLSVTGTTLGSSYTDIKFSQIDSNNDKKVLLEKFYIPTEGFQLSETSIRGNMMYVAQA